MLDGVLPGKGGVEEKAEIKLPEFIPEKVLFRIESEEDVDSLPRGALAHLVSWDEDLAYDLVVAGAGVTFLDRETKETLSEHEDFDAEGFGVIDEQGLWLPGMAKPYEPADGGWRKPESSEEE